MMFDVKNRQDFLKASFESLDELILYGEAFDFPDEFDEPYEKFMESVTTFSLQFKHRFQMLDEPQFKNAASDAELRQAAIKRKFEAQKWLNEYHARKKRDQRDAWKGNAEITANELLQDTDMDAIIHRQWEDIRRANVAEAHLAECDVLIKATSQKEAAENV